MVQEETNLVVADNSGAKKVRCIRVFGGSTDDMLALGDFIVVSVKTRFRGGVKKGEVSKAVIVRTKKEVRRKDGHTSVSMKMPRSSKCAR